MFQGLHGGSGLQTTESGGGFVCLSNLWKASGRKFLSMLCSCLWDMWIQVTLPGGSGQFVPSQDWGTNPAQPVTLPGDLGGCLCQALPGQPHLCSVLMPSVSDFLASQLPPGAQAGSGCGCPERCEWDALLQCWQDEEVPQLPSGMADGGVTPAAWPAEGTVS